MQMQQSYQLNKMQRYQKLFKELYQQRLINKQTPTNSFDRVLLIQKKMQQNVGKKHSRLNLSLKTSDQCQFLDDVQSQAPKRIVRQTFTAPKTFTGRKLSLQPRNQSFQQFGDTDSAVRCMTSYLQKKKSLTQRQKPSISYPTGLYHTKKYQIVKKQAATPQPSNRSVSMKRSTPSRNVLIAGCNLQLQAENHRKHFRDMEVQMQKYNAQMKIRESQASRSLAERIKINRYERQNNIGARKQNTILKQTKHMMKKLQSSRPKQKEQPNQLMPWTVLVPQYQYY